MALWGGVPGVLGFGGGRYWRRKAENQCRKHNFIRRVLQREGGEVSKSCFPGRRREILKESRFPAPLLERALFARSLLKFGFSVVAKVRKRHSWKGPDPSFRGVRLRFWLLRCASAPSSRYLTELRRNSFFLFSLPSRSPSCARSNPRNRAILGAPRFPPLRTRCASRKSFPLPRFAKTRETKSGEARR